MTDEQIKHMVNRFLGWRLPENFAPDDGISFQPEYNVEYNAARGLPPSRRQPSGTNLLDAVQAEAMIRYMVAGMPESQKRLILHNAMVRIATSYPCRCEASEIADKALDEAARVSS